VFICSQAMSKLYMALVFLLALELVVVVLEVLAMISNRLASSPNRLRMILETRWDDARARRGLGVARSYPQRSSRIFQP
jgi:hypothetical protein